ncbi:hypothetical protein CPB86DRAFT_783684, partial [Serendipita vermifera]
IKSFETVPVEIWGLVVHHSLMDTLLFSVSPVDYSWRFTHAIPDWTEPAYQIDAGPQDRYISRAIQEFRRRKAQLRSVCRAWRWYTDSPQVKALHVQIAIQGKWQQEPSVGDVVRAKRLEVLHTNPDLVSGLDGVLETVIRENRMLEAEIIIDIGGTVINRVLRINSRLFPHLTALHIDMFSCRTETPNLDQLLPKLTALTCLSLMVEETFVFTEKIFCLPQLTSLDLHSAGKPENLNVESWHLPSLRHLKIDGLVLRDSKPYALEPIFCISGRLQSLSLPPTSLEPFKVAMHFDMLWTKCPQLTQLNAPISFVRRNKLPTGHPLRHLVNSGPETIASQVLGAELRGMTKPFDSFLEFCSSAHDLRIITDSHGWEFCDWRSPSVCTLMAERLERHHIRYEDHC